MGRRLDRERRTLDAMVHMYCRDRHGTGGELCEDCAGLLDYALARLEGCGFGEAKPTCANCPVHCYRPDMRERVREVMRHAGPRMLLRHPLLALAHMLDGPRRAPER